MDTKQQGGRIMKQRLRGGFATVAVALVIMAVMATSFLAGVNIGHEQNSDFVIDGTAVPSDLHQPLHDLWQGYQHLNADSYWRPFDHKQLIYNATSGMLDACCPGKDTHTTYLQPAVNHSISVSLNEGTYGIGAEVVMTPRGLQITEPLIGSPAIKAGLRQNDLIVAVNGRDIRKLSSAQAVALIHGRQGTTVALTIVRQGVAKPFVVRVTRDTIPGVMYNQYGSVGYMAFSGFDVDTGSEFHGTLSALLARHIKSLIVDLRGNGGGYVDTARQIASEFLPKGAVIFWERSNLGNGRYSDVSTTVSNPGIAQRLPVVVLVDGYTASAAEIFTAALREHGRARVVGTTTYGKGSVQEDLPLPDGSSLRITIRLWLTPDKHTIDNQGITPDVVVGPENSGPDRQLQAAIALLATGG
jgi:carboxyl-terminal processing protease